MPKLNPTTIAVMVSFAIVIISAAAQLVTGKWWTTGFACLLAVLLTGATYWLETRRSGGTGGGPRFD